MSRKIGETPSTAARGRQWGTSKEEDDFDSAQGSGVVRRKPV